MVQPMSFFRRHPKTAPLLVYFLSLCYLVFLVSSTQPGIFFSGDGGMKFIVVKQLQTGHGFKYLYLPQPDWVHKIWQSGYFPFGSPFVYPSPNGNLFSFPPYFQLVSAGFYHMFGYSGLYILPVGSAVVLWLVMIGLLRGAGVTEGVIAVLLFLLVFCSPLTLYGAAYWEHMPAVLLLCGGSAFILRSGRGPFVAAVLGLLAGLAVWFRPEAIVLNFCYGIAAAFLFWRRREKSCLFFLGGLIVPVLGFLAVNQYEFGSLLGVHSYQVLQERGILYKIGRGCKNLFLVNWTSVCYFPFLVIVPLVVYGWWKGRIALDLRAGLLFCIILAFCVLTPFFLPNDGGMQWGARYFLPVIPIFLLAVALSGGRLGLLGRVHWPGLVAALLILGAGYAFVLNSFFGGVEKLRQANFDRVKPAMEFVKQQPGNVIVVGSSYIPMEMGSLFDEKYFFLVERDSSLVVLHRLLKQQNIHNYLYINQQDSSLGLPNLLMGGGSGLVRRGNYYFARYAVPD